MNTRVMCFLKSKYFFFRQLYLYLYCSLFVKSISNSKEIPIIINNFNRLSTLKKLIETLECRGYSNIYIIDNNSTYLPLLNYYTTTPYKVFRLEKNIGYLALWKTNIFKQFRNSYYVYTDSDIILDPLCPADFLDYFLSLMKKYPRASKVGFGLKISDIPDCYVNKELVVRWESQFWIKEVEPNVFLAPIDTTFALYRPRAKGRAYFNDFMLRTGGAYLALHLPWYTDSERLSKEEAYYIKSTQTSTHWTKL